VVDFAALTRPVRVSARAVTAPPRQAAEVIALVSDLAQPIVLAGSWDAGEIVVAVDPIHLERQASDPFDVLDQQPTVVGPVAAGAVGGGWFGWFGFPAGSSAGERPPHALAFYPNVLRLRDGQWWDEALVGLLDDDVLEVRRQLLRERLAQAVLPVVQSYSLGPVRASRDRAGHAVAVERCIQDIRAGEIYQANICLTLLADFTGSSAALAADLLAALQPPYGAFAALGDVQVASASPELFLRRHGRQVRSRPIKGTRPRTGVDAELEKQRLAGSQKDRAENVMIVDLVRNDLSRVAEIGSVRVPELLDIVAHPGVWHLVSTVEAQLRAGVTDAQLLRATFPPGSVSGTPKHRAIDVIAELEERPRGVYTGAIGYASPAAGAEFSVAIRTAEIRGTQFSLGVGGGITVDSTPVQEWYECFDKAWPLLASIGGRIADPTSTRPAPDPRIGGGVFDTSLLHFGQPLERAEHLARLERSVYELYQLPLPAEATAALLQTPTNPERWQRQRIDVMPDGSVRITRSKVPAPVSVEGVPGQEAIVVRGDGFGGHKWSDRGLQLELEQAHPDCVVILGDESGLLESTRANVIAVVDGKLVTPPLDGRILPGVTRTVLLELARDLGIEIELRSPNPQQAQALATIGSVGGLRWIRRCSGLGVDVSYDDPGDVFRELSQRLVTRWTGGVTVPG
jgi:para-aminobenzoate synthetase/4-amino-4-deoxychorismate lyase